MEIRKNVVLNRAFKKLTEYPEDQDVLLVDHEFTCVDSVIDCVDAILEVNADSYLTGWRLLMPQEELPKGLKIYNLPQSWKKRLGADDDKKPDDPNMMNELAGENPYLHLKKNISSFYPADESVVVPNANGSVFRYERIYLVKWQGMSISEATWERVTDIVDVDATADSRIDVAAQQTPSGDGKRRRGRPRKSEAAPSRRNRMLRLCIDPNPPTINKGRCGEWLRRSGGEGQWIPCAALGHLAPRS